MSKRLQVLLDEAELRDIRRVAKASHQTVSEWARQALRTARCQMPARDAGKKLLYVREAVRHSYPAPDIKQMLAEIEKGYTGGGSP
jgi:hypothetical protein